MTEPLLWTGPGPAPADRPGRVASLHAGHLLVLPPTDASRSLVRATRSRVRAALGVPADVAWSRVQAIPTPYSRLGPVRQALGHDPHLRGRMAAAALSAGFADGDQVDAPRLRSISSGAEVLPQAAPVYLLHRDTWYGCPDALLVAWVPLQDTPAHDMFAFYPQWFDRPVPNTSEVHDHDRWMAEVGWHGSAPLDRYAAPTAPVREDAFVFDVPEASILLFSAAQLHQTRPIHTAPWTRYSVDFRILPTGAEIQSAAPAVDNRSVGAALRVAREFTAISELAPPVHVPG